MTKTLPGWSWFGATVLVAFTVMSGASTAGAQNAPRVPERPSASWSPSVHPSSISTARSHSAPADWTSPPRPHVPGGVYAAESTNWSGEIATGTTFSSIAGNWVVPAVQPAASFEASSNWIGIDGGPSSPSTILQTGTTEAMEGGTTVYYAWYEVYPNSPVVFGLVSPGDQMEASIVQNSGTSWTLALTDVTSGNNASVPLTYAGPADSAEWIEELPTAVSPPQPYLANFGSVQFTGITLVAAGSNVVSPVDMVDGDGNVIARTGNQASSTFTVTYVPEQTSTAVAANPGSSVYGSAVTYSATVGSAGPPPTGTVAFTVGSTSLCTATISNGSGSCVATNTPQGNDVVQGVYSGDANSTSSSGSTAVAVAAPPQHGYWLVGSDGGIFTFGSAQFYGSTGNLRLQRPVVGITPTSDRGGYWLVASDGGIFSFGDSGFYGSIPGLGLHPAGSGLPNSLNAPIVGMVPSSDGGGYFMVASDGGVFAFGDAKFAGSCPGIGGCVGSAVAVMPDASGKGYWVVTNDGSVYGFGDAPYYGGPGTQSVPVTSAVRTPDGKGYWILFSNGVVAPYGDAAGLGGPVGLGGLNYASAIFATADGNGYWVASTTGQIFPYGDAPNDGSMAGTKLNGSIIAGTGW